MHAATIVVVYASLIVILGLIFWMLLHWRRFRNETDRYRAWQSVFGRRGGKAALLVGFVALAVLVGGLLAYQGQLSTPP
ncbi:MAG TPA: hypothetical protein VIC62_11005 [Nakamurella sp.]|jgi:hypothetical protein